jgi:hypothetical protein
LPPCSFLPLAAENHADVLPRRTARMETRLKQIRRAAGDARDYHVLAQRLSDEARSDIEGRRQFREQGGRVDRSQP